VGSVAEIFGHLHYSIDVFSAFFIAYGVFEIAKKIFKKEYLLLTNTT
jgi:membrane-associated phospholipid phosphatase